MAPEETVATTEAPPPKSKKMLFIGLAVGFLVLAGINGVLVWKVLSNDSADAKMPEPKEVVTVEKEESGLMYQLDPFIVNLFDERGVRYLKVRLDIELWDITEEEMAKKDPKVRDSLIVLLSSKKYEEIGSLEGKARLREEILFRLNRILGEGKAKEVYFTDFVVQ
jgi:flagellar FliL protein